MAAKKDPLFYIGIVGTVAAAICCFTPALGIVGLSVALAWFDFVLVSVLYGFVCLTGYAVLRHTQD